MQQGSHGMFIRREERRGREGGRDWYLGTRVAEGGRSRGKGGEVGMEGWGKGGEGREGERRGGEDKDGNKELFVNAFRILK